MLVNVSEGQKRGQIIIKSRHVVSSWQLTPPHNEVQNVISHPLEKMFCWKNIWNGSHVLIGSS